MTALFFERAWVNGGWKFDVRVEIENGRICHIVDQAQPLQTDESHWVGLPGMINAHSHAFQRGMAGWAEARGSVDDDFWTWRQCMYHFLDKLTPDDVQAIAAQCYVEMLEAGFTRVGEFHYLHHDVDGKPYSNLCEMASRIFAAAETTGIGLTMLPSFYAHGDFGAQPFNHGQRRFICDLNIFYALVEQIQGLAKSTADANVGIAPHSLRAVSQTELRGLVSPMPSTPIHLHVAEQEREVATCVEQYGCRPIEWLMDNFDVDSRWCLVHCTQATESELVRMTKSGATVCLCPITEANLGDGIFDAARFVSRNGQFAIGSDSNIELSVTGELKQLEYSQRLRDRRRNVLSQENSSTGEMIFEAALRGGNAALGQKIGGINIGAPADFVSLSASHPILGQAPKVLDAWIFSAGSGGIDCVWRRGRKVVASGRHISQISVRDRFIKSMARLAT